MTTRQISRKPRLTQEALKAILEYDPATGIFSWLVVKRCAGGRTKIGQKAGFIRAGDGYVFIGIDGFAYQAQNLAWLYMTGEWPQDIVDHENRNRADNRWVNLRPATWVQNCQNKNIRSDNKSGVTGVSFDAARGKWAARIRVDGRYLSLGRHSSKDDAISARRAAELRYFGEFAPLAA